MHNLNTICPPGYRHTGFTATGGLGYTHIWLCQAIMIMTRRAYCICIYTFLYIW